MWLESRANAGFPLGQILPSRRSIAQGRSSSSTENAAAVPSTRAAYAHALFRAGRKLPAAQVAARASQTAERRQTAALVPVTLVGAVWRRDSPRKP